MLYVNRQFDTVRLESTREYCFIMDHKECRNLQIGAFKTAKIAIFKSKLMLKGKITTRNLTL